MYQTLHKKAKKNKIIFSTANKEWKRYDKYKFEQ